MSSLTRAAGKWSTHTRGSGGTLYLSVLYTFTQKNEGAYNVSDQTAIDGLLFALLLQNNAIRDVLHIFTFVFAIANDGELVKVFIGLLAGRGQLHMRVLVAVAMGIFV